ncbi:unnamed protein product [Timema podura]|uniref:Uncharacterized protein n=1 Tax=Timema podura TaxID=61482 RepID=A0ABN7NP76_TIMPD|nr:unnamed protein product [Timema podura]
MKERRECGSLTFTCPSCLEQDLAARKRVTYSKQRTLFEMFQEKVLNTLEERRLLECDEAIEAIDSAIEYKNELICGRKGKGLDNNLVQREKCEEMLLARLMKLSSIEVRTLLYKYFQKVIDLRENGKKMEMQLAELDHHTETQAWKIQAMGNALKQVNLETERRIITLQREHEAKLHLMLRHFAEETSSSSGVEGVSRSHFILDSYAEVGKYKLRYELQWFSEGIFKHKHAHAYLWQTIDSQVMPVITQKKIDSSSSVQIPQQNLKRLQISSTPSTIKVTRQKNKLIIQQQKKS